MRRASVRWGVGLLAGLALVAAGCSRHGDGGHGAHGTTTGVTIPVDGWAIAGTTQVRVCPPHTSPETCGTPFRPAAATVTVRRDGAVVQQTVSGADGRFRIPVAPGSYQVDGFAMGVQCPAQDVVVAGPPVPTAVTVSCTVFAP